MADTWYMQYCGPGYNDRLPDPGFMDKLAEIDPCLFVRWVNRAERWQVCRIEEIEKRSDPQGIHHILWVQDENGEYMPADERILDRLMDQDTWNAYSKAEWYARFCEQRKAFEERRRKRLQDDVHELAKKEVDLYEHLPLTDRNFHGRLIITPGIRKGG